MIVNNKYWIRCKVNTKRFPLNKSKKMHAKMLKVQNWESKMWEKRERPVRRGNKKERKSKQNYKLNETKKWSRYMKRRMKT